jgi:hypothetical protein
MRVFALVLVALSIAAICQAAEEDKAQPEPWKHSLVGALNLTEVGFKDWAKGGEGALSWTLTFDGKSVNDLEKTNWTTSYKAAFGQTKLETQDDYRKTEDKLDVESVFAYKLSLYVNPFVSGTLKTQFDAGFIYEEDGTKKQVSKMFDPAYLTQAAGLGFVVRPEVKTRIGAALREIITSDYNSYADDPDTPDEIEKTRIDGGIESVTDVEWQLEQNVLLKSKLELFVPLKAIDEISVISDSTLAVKLHKYVTATFNIILVKDKTLSEDLQLKRVTTVGLSYVFM